MIIGAITNSWAVQLDGDNLPNLVHEAKIRGAKHVELRQTFLGNCESGFGGEWRPVMANLKSLVELCPDISFNLAMALPFLSGKVNPGDGLFRQSIEAAKVVGRNTPHLRLVDPTPQKKDWENHSDIPEEAFSLVGLVEKAVARGVTVSVENSGQSVGALTMLVNNCREQLSEGERGFLGLCVDPANQIRNQPMTDALADLDSLPIDMLKIVHFKQSREGRPIPTVADGDLDCSRMVSILESKGYDGPAIFEIPPHEDVFNNLSASISYVKVITGIG